MPIPKVQQMSRGLVSLFSDEAERVNLEKPQIRQEFYSHKIGLVHQHCWHFTVLVLTNMAAMTSCENTLSPGQMVRY